MLSLLLLLPLIIVFFPQITQLDEQLHGAVEVIGKVERDCSLSSQRIIPYDQEFGECFSLNFSFLKKGCLKKTPYQMTLSFID